MIAYRLEIPPHVAEIIRHLPPDVKHSIRSAMRSLCSKPESGEPLLGLLEGLWKYRVRRFRIVYSIDRRSRLIKVFAVGHRRGIYEEVTDLVGGHR